MEQLKALAKDPAKLEAKLKEDWAKMDTKGEGSVTFEVFAEAGKKMQQALNLNKEPTDEEKQKYKQLLDPNNTEKLLSKISKSLLKLDSKNLNKYF